ncbi:MAG: glycosyltransferase [Acetobacteraceae bacterium]|nr:glycosyltransferase [Acetobacteraceae bacterium]
MEIGWYRALPRPIRMLARAALIHIPRLSGALESRWPKLGGWLNRLVLFLVWHVQIKFGFRRRDSEPDQDSWPDIAPEQIDLSTSDAPEVSVIVPTYGQTGFTLRCLASIQAHLPAVPIEVIVVDDAFPGVETAALARVKGIRLIRHETNLGFIRTCNGAARAAHGRFLLFLNNDTQVRPGWLDHLVALFAARPDAGIAGSKLLALDGTLQEAGGILWNDGSAWNYGRGRDPAAPEFNYTREVDYCSAASLLVRRDVFLDVGGFDEIYAPAYCEDSDLSFRLRRLGLKTYYQPRSEIVHYEGMSHGRDPGQGIKAFQVTNQAKFFDVWREVLTREHFPNGTHVPRARDRAHDRQVVLIVDHYVPEPDRDAGSRTMIAFVRALLSSGAVVKFWPFNLCRTPGYTEALQDIGVEVFHGPGHALFPVWLKVHGGDLDLVMLCRPDIAELCLDPVRAHSTARVVYYGHDLHFRRMQAQSGPAGDFGQRRAAEAMRVRESAIWRAADLVLYPSEEESGIVRKFAPAVTVRAVVPYAFAGEPECRDPPDAHWIVFVAGFGHPPNAEGAAWFVREVLPSIVARVPEARLAIVGSHPSAAVQGLRGPYVSLFANVSDAELAAWYRRARVAVVPLLTGAGVKLKTVEALWHGVPAVVTPVGAQGLPGLGGVVPIETKPDAFSAAVCSLLGDDGLWRRRSAAQVAYARARFSVPVQTRSLLRALDIEAEPLLPPAVACAETMAMA